MSLQQAITSPWDDKLSDNQFVIDIQSSARTINWHEGKINVTVTREPFSAYSLHFNFDLKSQDSVKLRQWLGMTVEAIHQQVDHILYNIIGLTPEEIENG